MVDCTGLENRRTERYRGFESLSLRKKSGTTKVAPDFRFIAAGKLAYQQIGNENQMQHRRWLLISCKGTPKRDGRAKRSQSVLQQQDYLLKKRRNMRPYDILQKKWSHKETKKDTTRRTDRLYLYIFRTEKFIFPVPPLLL